jgi:8-oxo-dGTP diphosphatase
VKYVLGVAAVISDSSGNVLLQQRRKHPGFGLDVLSGGRVDDETPIQAIVRELKEEIGIDADPNYLYPVHFGTDVLESGEQVLMLYYATQIVRGSERNMEPQKCAGLVWYDFGKLPRNNMWANDVAAIFSYFGI